MVNDEPDYDPWIFNRALAKADKFMPQARDAWTRFTDRPWNKHAMRRALAEFAYELMTEEKK